MDYNKYKNNGWGLSKPAFQELYKIITTELKCDDLNIIEFGSGKSTDFLVDVSLSLMNKKNINILSFDNDKKHMYKPKKTYDFLDLKLKNLLECSDNHYEKMFKEKKYIRLGMNIKNSQPSTRQKNCFYDINQSDLKHNYNLVILDGPNGNGRNIGFLHLKEHLINGSYVLIDDYTHYDFVDRFLSIFDAVEVFKTTNGREDKWNKGGDFIIFKIK